MLSFELSVIDIVLAVAIVILLLLHITRRPTRYITKPELSRERRKPLEESRGDIVMPKASKTKKSFSHLPEDSVECPYHLGYLKTLPNRSSIPEECYYCSRMSQCLFSGE